MNPSMMKTRLKLALKSNSVKRNVLKQKRKRVVKLRKLLTSQERKKKAHEYPRKKAKCF